MPDFSLDFFDALFEYNFMGRRIKRLFIDHLDHWWWLNPVRE